MVASVDLSELDAEEAEQVSRALDQLESGLAEPDSPVHPGAADTFHYKLEIRRGEQVQTAEFDERQMPAGLAVILRALMRRAVPGRTIGEQRQEP